MPIWDYFGSSYALHLLLAVFEINFCCRESPNSLPFKPLILTPLAKIADKWLLLQFCWQFVLRTRPWHHQQTEQKDCQLEQDVDQILYLAMDGGQCQNKDHGDTAPKKRATCVYVLLRSIYKKRARRGSVLQTTCGLPEKNKISSKLYISASEKISKNCCK